MARCNRYYNKNVDKNHLVLVVCAADCSDDVFCNGNSVEIDGRADGRADWTSFKRRRRRVPVGPYF